MLSSESHQSKLERKQEAKNLKRQRILDAGGKRPRKKRTEDEEQKHQHNNKKKKKQNNKTQPHNDNRFGKVMVNTPCRNKPRTSTLSLAIPGSIVSNAQTTELRTYLIGQIARACTIYHIDEVIVFDDNLSRPLKVRFGYNRGGFRGRDRGDRDYNRDRNGHRDGADKNEKGDAKETTPDEKHEEKDETKKELKPSTDPHTFMANILQYCECPQYLRRHFFPMHPDLQFAGLLNPLDAPHHVRLLDRCLFRDGVVTDKKGKGIEGGEEVSLVDCGVRGKLVEIDRSLPAGIRCTVQIEVKGYGAPGKKHMKGKVVSPSAPREHDGTYWGYSVRMASSIKAIFDEAPYENGYDLKIGTSERGNLSVDDVHFPTKISTTLKSLSSKSSSSSSSSFEHAVIVLGGVAGIEECVDADETMNLSGNDSATLFDLWVNICEYQGSRTIRTEEAVMISLSRLCPYLFPINKESEGDEVNPTTSLVPPEDINSLEFSDDAPSEEESSSGGSEESD